MPHNGCELILESANMPNVKKNEDCRENQGHN